MKIAAAVLSYTAKQDLSEEEALERGIGRGR